MTTLTTPRLTSPVAPSMTTDVTVVTDQDGVLAIADAWCALRRRHGATEPDSTPQRVLAVVAAMDGDARPHVVLVRRGDEPVALLIGRTVTRREPCRIGYLSLPAPRLRWLEILHGGLIADPNTIAPLLTHIRELMSTGTVDAVSVSHLPTSNPTTPRLLATLRRCGDLVSREAPHWRRQLVDPETGEPIRRHSSKTRSTFRRKDRRLAEHFDDDLRLEIVSEPDTVAQYLVDVEAIARRTYHAGLGAGVRNTPLWRGVLGAMAREQTLHSYLLRGGDRPIAYLLGSIHNDVMTIEATGFDPDLSHLSPGLSLLCRVVTDLTACGVQSLDFGFGDAAYKRQHGSEQWIDTSIRCYRRAAAPCLGWIIDRGSCSAHDVAGRLLTRTGLLDTVRTRWRDRLRRTAAPSSNPPVDSRKH